MKELMKRCMTLLLSLAMIITYMPLSMITAYAEDGDEPTAAVPLHQKLRAPNGDGTYKLSLDITGDADTEKPTAKANILVVYDVSGSMTQNSTTTYKEEMSSTTGTHYGYYNGEYVTLRYRNGEWQRQNSWGWWVEYTGTRYTATTARRADAAEKVVYDFADALFEYNKGEGNQNNVQMALIAFSSGRRNGSYDNNGTESSGNPGDSTTAAWLVQDWTNSESTYLNKFSSTGNNNSAKLKYGGGTNWEAAMQRTLAVLGSNNTDSDPTYVVFVTDGLPTFYVTGGNGSSTTSAEYRAPEGEVVNIENYNTANHSYSVPADSNTTLFGIFAYGGDEDRLDDLIYYAQNGTRRETYGTTATPNYYNATDQASLNQAISDIFNTIAETLGVGSVAITDGTTTNVQTQQGVSHLLAVEPNTYEYWLTIPVQGNGPYTTTRKDLVSSEDYTITFTEAEDGSYTATWTDSAGTHEVTGIEGSVDSGKFKYHWTEANDLYKFAPPEARYVDSESAVKWDLSSVGTLLDGVTYTVTFNVYPTQETYDMIADLDNAEDPAAAYEALDPAIKQYLKRENNGSYTLETNTTTDLAYVDSRVDDTVHHLPFKNPPRVATAVSKMDITKRWFNNLDDKDQEDYANGFDMDVTRDGTVFDQVTVKPDNNWKDNIFISTGLMRVHRDDDENITGIEVLDAGHDYTLKEPANVAYTWELVIETLHPMLVNGELHSLVEVKGEDIPKGMGNADFYTLEGVDFYRIGDKVYEDNGPNDEDTASVSAYNERKSFLDITKVITGNAADAPKDAKFDYTVSVASRDGSEVWFSVQDKDGKFVSEQASITGATAEIKNGEKTGYYYATSGSTITFKLQEGWNLRFINLPTYSTYTVVESSTMDPGFTFDNVDGITEFSVGGLPDGAVDLGNNQYTYDGVIYTKEADKYNAVYEPKVTGTKVEGKIVSANAPYQVTYANKYTPTRVAPKVTKTVSGWDAAEAFNFSIEAADDTTTAAVTAGDVVLPESTTATTGTGMKDGDSKTVSFGDITFNKVGTYKFTVKETNTPAPAGWTYANKASDAKTITVVVTSGTEGLESQVTGDNPTFTNSYHAEKVTGKIPVVKNITPANSGAADITGKFTFTLEGKNGAPMPAGTTGNKATVTCGADGVTVFFDEIEFTEAGTYNYEVSESVTDGTAPKDGIALDTTASRTVTVVVSDDGSGKLSTNINSNNPVSFNNPYSVTSIDVQIPVEKILSIPEGLTGPEDIKDEYTFTLEGKNGAPMPSGTGNVVTNPDPDGGTARFGTITYSAPGTYNYTVTESGEVDGVDNDKTATKNVVVVVTDKHDGTMGYTINNGEGVSFTNDYDADKTSAVIPVKKVLTGKNAPTITDEFTFTLKEGDKVVGTVKSNGSGNIVKFNAIEYTEPGTHTYTVTESGTVEGVTNDTSVQTVTVTVTDNKEGKLVADVSATDDDPIVFNNLYRETSIQIPVSKILDAEDGLNTPDITGKYTFTLTGKDGAPMPEGTGNVVTNPKSNGGTAYFGPITYKTPGEYEYTVTETGEVEGVDNDSVATKTVKVKVYYKTVTDETTETDKVDVPAVTEEVEEPVLDENGDPVEEPVLDENGDPVLDDEGNPVTEVKMQTVTKVIKEATTEEKEVTRETQTEVLVAEIIDGNNLFFTNTYDVNPTTVKFPVKKEVSKPDDTECPNIKNKFTFTLTAGTNTAAGDIDTPMPTVTSYTNPDADGGTVTFGDITYNAPGVYNYTVTESGTVPGIANQNPDNATVTVRVVDDGKGNLSAEASSTTGDPLTFRNSYTYDSITATLQVHKDLKFPEGVTRPNITEKYTFTLTGKDGAPMPEGTGNVVTNPENGTAAFGTITYSKPGKYTYTITESGSVIGVKNDAEAATGKTVEVTVSDDHEGKLVAKVDYKNNTGHALFTNEYDVVEVPVTKVWKDSDNQDGIRPASVTVKLKGLSTQQIEAFKAVGITVPESATISADEDGNWSYTFENLPKYALNGTEVEYTVEEETTKVITGTDGPGTYIFEVKGDAAKGFTVTNTHTPETTSLNGKKIWKDEDYEGERPDSVVVELWRQIGDGAKEVVKTAEGEVVKATVSEDTDWEFLFDNLPKYANEGTKITYSIVEQAVANYLTVLGENQENADGTFTQDVTNTNETFNPSTSTFFTKSVGTPNTIKDATFEFSAVQVTDASGNNETEDGWTSTGSVTYAAGEKGDKAIKFDKKILYTEVGTYYYKITETKKPDGWKASTDSVVVAVDVALNDEGELVATTDGGSITNNYGVESTTAKFPVEKELEVPAGLTPASIANKFTFTLTAGTNTAAGEIATPMPTVTSYTNPDADGGTVTFGDITYTAPGVYNYTVTETGEVDGVTNDKTATKAVIVTVVDKGDGTLEATADSTTAKPLTFTNKYDVSDVTAKFPVKKELEVPAGLTPASIANKFTFTLTAGTNTAAGNIATPMPKVTSYTNPDADGGTVTFGDITYTAPGVYNYTVTETGEVDGVTNDKTATKAVTVTVVDKGDGTLEATADSTTDEPLTFTNKYDVSDVTAKFPVKKELEVPAGLTPASIADKFTFTLTAGTNTAAGEIATPMPTVTSYTNPDADGGTVTFGDITYTAPGVYNYTVTETGKADGVTNDSVSSKAVTVTVVDKGDGTLEATPSVNSQNPLKFTNTYNVDKALATIPVVKMLASAQEGLNLPDITEEYTFTLAAQDGAPLVDKDGKAIVTELKNPTATGGSVTFGTLAFSNPGTYKYTVSESGTVAGVTNDKDASKIVEIVVTDNGNGTMSAVVNAGKEVTFTNTYDVNETTAKFPVKKELEVPAGLTPASIANKFTFTLTAGTNTAAGNIATPMPTVTSYTNPDADGGTVTFGDITYTAPGVYNYTVTETGAADGVTNDAASTKNVKVTVVDKGDGTLEATADSTTAKPLTFTNKYDVSETTVKFPVEKELEVPVGLKAPSIANKFTFTLKAGTNTAAGKIATPMPAATSYTNPDADGGTVTFGDITYTAPGVYNYTVTETGEVDGVTNDPTATKAVTVTVVDKGDGTLEATADSTTAEPLTFTNKYDVVPVDVDTTQMLTKTVTKMPPKTDSVTFEFALTAGTNTAVAPEGETVATPVPVKAGEENTTGSATFTKAESKTIDFGTLTFTKPGVYNYTLTEDIEKLDGGWTTQGNPANVQIEVKDNSDGTMSATVTGGNITNTFETRVVEGEKSWNDAKYFDENGDPLNGYERPSVTIKLLADGVVIQSKTVTAEDNWQYSFTDLPVNKNHGTPIVYTIEEEQPEGYTEPVVTDFNVDNTPVPDEEVLNPTSFEILKTDAVTGGYIGTGAEFTLYKGEEEVDKYTTGDNGRVTVVFEQGGHEDGTYTLKETNAPEGYQQTDASFTIVVDKEFRIVKLNEDKTVWQWIYDLVHSSTNAEYKDGVLTVPNPPELTEFKANKVWNDNKDKDKKRPTEIKLTLTGKAGTWTDTKEQTVKADSEGNWSYTWKDLVGYHNGIKVDYEVTEAPVTDYTTKYSKVTGSVKDGYEETITNSHQSEPLKEVFTENVQTKIDGELVKPGQKLQYKITYVNTTGRTAENATITDKIPAYTEFVSADNGGTYDEKTGVVTWELNDVEDGTEVIVSFWVKVLEDSPASGEALKNTAVVHEGQNDYSTNEVSNPTPPKKTVYSGTTSTEIDGEPVKSGDVLRYEIKYTNPTDETVEATITDKIPAHTTLVKDSISEGGDLSGTQITWKKSVDAGKSVTVSFQVKVDEDVSGQILTNESTVKYGENEYTSNEVSNPTPPKKEVFTGSSTTNIDGKDVEPGDELTYQITFVNDKVVDGKPVDVEANIKDEIPAHTKYVEGSADATGGTYADGVVTWKKTVAASDTWTVSFKVKVDGNAAGEELKNKAVYKEGENGKDIESNEVVNPVTKELEIKKSLATYLDHGEFVQASFSFRVTGTYEEIAEDGTKTTKNFNTVVGLDFNSESDIEQTKLLTGLPSTLKDVKVEEVYSGNYDPDKTGPVSITEDGGTFKVEFSNKFTDDYEPKGGVTNKYVRGDNGYKYQGESTAGGQGN